MHTHLWDSVPIRAGSLAPHALQVQQQRSQQRLAAAAQQRERNAVQEAVQAAVQVCAKRPSTPY